VKKRGALPGAARSRCAGLSVVDGVGRSCGARSMAGPMRTLHVHPVKRLPIVSLGGGWAVC
jgi:hypothetical protein